MTVGIPRHDVGLCKQLVVEK